MRGSTTKPGIRAILAAALVVGALGEVTGSGPLLLGGHEAHAVVGRPMTPVSYAGVARRTTRRSVAYGAHPAPVAVGVHPYVASGVVTALPAGCGAFAGGYYTCGGVRYRPYYNGPTLVYEVVR